MSPDFHLDEHPLVLLKPRIVAPYGWVGHIPFAYLAIDLLRPRCLVELGTHSGNSYLAFCQAARALELPCQFTAVDDWRGDEHAQHYGEQVYQALRSRHDPQYGAFSTLLRLSFDQAASSFADGSIDLLHIDGLHTYEAVRHDFETWLPKLSARAVVLLHDIEVHGRGFGVYRFFEELSGRYPCFAFRQSHGLGVVAVGAEVPAPFTAFMNHARRAPEVVRGFFETLAGTLVDQGDRPVAIGAPDALPVVCHMYYRTHAGLYEESRMISQPVEASDGVVDLEFQIPAGERADYLRIDPADLPGVYRISRLGLLQGPLGAPRELDRLATRIGHVNGELLAHDDPLALRLVSFDGDPNVEFEIDSALAQPRADEPLTLSVRITYEVVVDNPLLHRLLEKQSTSMTDMRQLARERAQLQGLTRDLASQRGLLQNLMSQCNSQQESSQAIAAAVVDLAPRVASLTAAIDGSQREQLAGQRRVEQAIEQLSRRGFWSWLRRRFRAGG